jgi:hypothetical protein
MSYIFKIYINSYDKKNLSNYLSHIIIFLGEKFFHKYPDIDVKNLQKFKTVNDFLKSKYINLIEFDDIFNEQDHTYFKDFNMQIKFTNQNIYFDDTIEVIKFKIIDFLNKEFDKICYEELYLFSCLNNPFNPINIYNLLSNNNKNKISKKNLYDFLSNIYEQYTIINYLEDKDFYDYNDINELANNIFFINEFKSIGQNPNNNFKYIINPFNNNETNLNEKMLNSNIINTNNNSMLFENNITNFTFYISIFQDILTFFNSKYQKDYFQYIIKVYFPLLNNKNINSLIEYNNKHDTLLNNTFKLIKSSAYINKNTFIDILHDIDLKTPNINKFLGTKKINFTIHSFLNYNISLESIFKILNSSENYPIIKFNPGKKQDNIYRLYCNNNNKIPLLSQKDIIKYSKILGKTNTISMIVNNNNSISFKKFVKDFFLDIDITGAINIKITFTKIVKIIVIEDIIKKNVNPLIKKIRGFLINNNSIKIFESLLQDNVEINNIDYELLYSEPFNKLNNFNLLKNHLSFLFNIVDNKSTKTKKLVYKHVSNYSNENEKTTFVINQIKEKNDPSEIIINLKNKFNLESTIIAKEIFEEIIQTLSLLENNYNYKKFNIKNSGGFDIKIETIENDLKIFIFNIDNIFYINKLILFFDSIIKLLTNNKTNLITDEKIIQFFKNKTNIYTNSNHNFIKDIDEKHDNHFIGNQLVQDKEIDHEENIINVNSNSISLDDSDDIFKLLLDDEDDGEEDSKIINSANSLEEDNNFIDHNISLKSDEEDDFDQDVNIKDFEESVKIYDDYNDDDDDVPQVNEDEEIKIGKANPILKRLLKYEKKIFTKKIEMLSGNDNKYFTNYSRLCQSKRQPVIINEEEKQAIDTENPGAYDNIIEYSSNKNNKHYYICPRFWDIKKNIPLTKEQVDSGNYGNLITKKSGNIMTFDKDINNHIPKTPGFLKNKTTDGFCLPCCFNKSIANKANAKILKKIKKCNSDLKKIQENNDESLDSQNLSIENTKINDDDETDDETDDNTDDETDDEDTIKNQGKQIYIINEKKFPLAKGKYGDIPLILRNFLQFDSNLCRSKAEPNLLKYKYRCLLRYGIEKNKYQSFLSCICDVYAREVFNNSSLSLKEFKKILIDSISLDDFISHNNGNLTSLFLSKDIDENYLNEFIIEEKYKDSFFYKILDLKNTNQVFLYKKIINAYQNFIKYIESNNNYIDYTYLWDIICKPNHKLFHNGINLIILDITNDDLTDNVKVICPKQNYSNEFLDENKLSLILIKNNEIFEPIYGVKDTLKLNQRVLYLFSFKKEIDDIQLNEFKKVLNIIKNDINENCLGKIGESNKQYTFEKNLTYENIKNILIRLNYEILLQIINYENKIIGIVIKDIKDNNILFLPCFPSSYEDKTIELRFIDDPKNDFYNDYITTKNTLKKISSDSEYKIKCEPIIRLINDNMLIGIITNGNQFIPLKEPEIYVKDELKELTDNNYLISDIKIQTSNKIDNERDYLVKKIKLETNFFNAFRKILKTQLDNLKNVSIKFELKNIIADISILYFDKLKIIVDKLNKLLIKYVVFENYSVEELENINEIIDCNIDEDDMDCSSLNCIYDNTNNICKLKIPENNLITNDNNEKIYYTKLADELIRYNKFSVYFFESENYINLENMKYKINDNELIIMQNYINKNLLSTKSNTKNEIINSNYDTFLIKNVNIKEPIDTSKFNFESKIQDIIKTDSKIKIKIAKDTKEKIDAISKKDLLYKPEECKLHSDIVVKKSQQLVNNFIDNVYEIYFKINKNKKCNINVFKIILDDFNKKNNIDLFHDPNEIISNLINYYSKNEYGVAFLHSVYHYTKNEEIKNELEIITNIKYKNKTYDHDIEYYVDKIINNNFYYFCYIDLYVLSKIYNIPLIFISTSIINIYISNENFIISSLSKNNNYYFIKIPSIHMRDEKNFKLIHLINSLSININNNIKNTNTLQLKTLLLRYSNDDSESDYDFFNIFIQKLHANLIETKKLTKFVKNIK